MVNCITEVAGFNIPSFDVEDFLGVLVDDVRNADRRDDLKKVGSNSFKQSPPALLLDGFLRNIPYTCIGWWMKNRALRLESCP